MLGVFRKVVLIILILFYFLCSFASAETIEIHNCNDLQNINNNLSGSYILTQDIDCSGFDYGDGKGFNPIEIFKGNFDGKNFTISNLKIDRGDKDYSALFGQADGAVIKNVILSNVMVEGKGFTACWVGSLLGRGDYVEIDNCHVISGSVKCVSGYYVGGLIGAIIHHNVTNSHSDVNVVGNNNVGGLIGLSIYSNIINSYSTGNVSCYGIYGGGLISETQHTIVKNSYAIGDVFTSSRHSGGLIGVSSDSNINSCYATGNVYGGSDYVGGLVGSCSGAISNSYATGDVTTSDDRFVGGLVGRSDYLDIINSYATGDVRGRRWVAGLNGYVERGDIINSYSTGEVIGDASVGGVVGELGTGGNVVNCCWHSNKNDCCGDGTCPDCYKSSSRSDFYLKTYDVYDTSSPYWDFTNIWQSQAYDYPILKWQTEQICSNGIKDGDETDTDCGGSCPKCAEGKSCLNDSDCESNYCNAGICETVLDLSVDSSDISFSKVGNKINISAIIKNSGKSIANNVEVKFLDTYNSNLVKETTINIGSIPAGNSKTASINWDLDENHVIYAIIGPNNKIKETDKSNNKANKKYTGTLKYYVETDVPPSKASNEIENYIKNNIKDGVIVTNKEEADIKVLVARHNPLIMWHFATIEEMGWGFYGGTIKFQGKTCSKPYCGVVGSIVKDGKKEIYIEANDVDGFIAASKAFVEKQDSFKTTGGVIFLDEENEDAIAVYDYLHTPSNLPYYKENSNAFALRVKNALNNQMYESDIKIINTTNNVMLRLKHLKPEYTNFQSYKDKNGLPVVLSRGIHSNLLSWEDFGKELANSEAKDTWLIEMVGGPYIDEDCGASCSTYTFDDLKGDYWPALIGAVQAYTSKEDIDYVGYSLGCSAALESLELYNTNGKINAGRLANGTTFDLSTYPIETFVAVACPGNFSELTTYMNVFNLTKEKVFNKLEQDNVNHPRGGELRQATVLFYDDLPSDIKNRLAWGLIYGAGFITANDYKMSKNIYDEFYTWINDPTKPNLGKNVNLPNVLLIQSKQTLLSPWSQGVLAPTTVDRNSDLIVPAKDMKGLCDNVQSSNKYYVSFDGLTHGGVGTAIPDRAKVKDLIKDFLNSKTIIENGYYESNQKNNCDQI